MKYIKYILILSVTIGLFAPIIEVNALTAPQGTCQYTYIAGRSSSTQRGTNIETEAACRGRTGTTSPVLWTTCVYTT
ncbi:MAG: hypothetical protein V4699_01885, partial [Patescibacteria group bacterium]